MKTCLVCGADTSTHWYAKLSSSDNIGDFCQKCYCRDWHATHDNNPETREKARQRAAKYRKENYHDRLTKERNYSKSDRGRFSNGKRLARRRSKDWSITLEEYSNIISQPCFYCSNTLQSPVTTGVGLDRLDNSIGYTIDNVVSCCGMCNTIRNEVLTVDEMKAVAKLIIDLRS